MGGQGAALRPTASQNAGNTTANPLLHAGSRRCHNGRRPFDPVSSDNSSLESPRRHKSYPDKIETPVDHFRLRPFHIAMGFDCGFDIFPTLDAANEADKRAYREFLDEIVDKYQDAYDKRGCRKDGKVLQLPGDLGGDFSSKDYILFMVGECPNMPANPDRCDYFLRFSSKVSGSLTACAEPYIRNVHLIAKKYFGDRVHWWHELNDLDEDSRKCWGYYDWSAVNEADKKLSALGTAEDPGSQSGNDGDGQRAR